MNKFFSVTNHLGDRLTSHWLWGPNIPELNKFIHIFLCF